MHQHTNSHTCYTLSLMMQGPSPFDDKAQPLPPPHSQFVFVCVSSAPRTKCNLQCVCVCVLGKKKKCQMLLHCCDSSSEVK